MPLSVIVFIQQTKKIYILKNPSSILHFFIKKSIGQVINLMWPYNYLKMIYTMFNNKTNILTAHTFYIKKIAAYIVLSNRHIL